MAEQKELSGALFKNNRKNKDTHPEYTGKALIDGQLYYVDAWVNDGKEGKDKWMSMKFKAAMPREQPTPEDYTANISQKDGLPF